MGPGIECLAWEKMVHCSTDLRDPKGPNFNREQKLMGVLSWCDLDRDGAPSCLSVVGMGVCRMGASTSVGMVTHSGPFSATLLGQGSIPHREL